MTLSAKTLAVLKDPRTAQMQIGSEGPWLQQAVAPIEVFNALADVAVRAAEARQARKGWETAQAVVDRLDKDGINPEERQYMQAETAESFARDRYIAADAAEVAAYKALEEAANNAK